MSYKGKKRIAKLREFIKQEVKKQLSPKESFHSFATRNEPLIDHGTFHRFIKGPPREQVSFNFVADILEKLNLPFAALDDLDLHGRNDVSNESL